MARKEISPYAPDVWIRQINKRYPSLWTDLRKVYAEPGSILSKKSGGIELIRSIPEWCIMPTMFPFLLITDRYGPAFYFMYKDEIMTMASMYIWRASKGIYRFAPEIYDALISQPLTGNLPTECLYRMPEWAVYIETPGMSFERLPMDGFIAHLDYNLYSRGVDLQFAIFWQGYVQPKMIALPLGEGSLIDAMKRIDQVDEIFMGKSEKRMIGTREEYERAFSAMLQLLLYLCSDEPDMPCIEHPRNRRTISGGVRGLKETRVWDVGVRISNAIRNFRNHEYTERSSAQGVHASPRPHVRSAHWHTYWTGPIKASFPERRPIIKWIPPIPVGVDWKRELPTHIKEVG